MIGIAGSGAVETATLADAQGANTLYTNQTDASLYGNTGNYVEQAYGFGVVDAYNNLNNRDTKGQGSVSYQLTYFGTWTAGS